MNYYIFLIALNHIKSSSVSNKNGSNNKKPNILIKILINKVIKNKISLKLNIN